MWHWKLKCVLSLNWLARVPSSCNVADAPSRGDVNGHLLSNAIDVSTEAEKLLEGLAAQVSEMGKVGCEPIPCVKRKRAHAPS